MPKFSQSSLEKLGECDIRLQEVFNEVVKYFDCSIVTGHRGQAEQHQAFISGKSKLDFPDSKHNSTPSKAVDAMPYYNNGIRWSDNVDTALFVGFVLGVATKMGIILRCGAFWDNPYDIKNNAFADMDHFEVVD
jgi:peptidoglycan LD-endopeptidase CwlK